MKRPLQPVAALAVVVAAALITASVAVSSADGLSREPVKAAVAIRNAGGPSAGAAPDSGKLTTAAHLDGVQVHWRNDMRCSQSNDGDKTTVRCEALQDSRDVVGPEKYPLDVWLPSRDFTVTVHQPDQRGAGAAQWYQFDNSGSQTRDGMLGADQSVTLRGTGKYDGSRANGNWGLALRHGGFKTSANLDPPIDITITYAPEANPIQYVRLDHSWPASCSTVDVSDTKETVRCKSVMWNIAGDQVSLYLPSEQYQATIRPVNGSPDVRWHERDLLYIQHATGLVAQNQAATLAGASAPEVESLGWHLGVESSSTIRSVSFDIDIKVVK